MLQHLAAPMASTWQLELSFWQVHFLILQAEILRAYCRHHYWQVSVLRRASICQTQEAAGLEYNCALEPEILVNAKCIVPKNS